MSLSYSLTEDEFYKLKQVENSLRLFMVLLEEVQRPTTMTPHMVAAWLELTTDSLNGVIDAAGTRLSAK